MYLEQRKGIQLNDLFYLYLPVKDLSTCYLYLHLVKRIIIYFNT